MGLRLTCSLFLLLALTSCAKHAPREAAPEPSAKKCGAAGGVKCRAKEFCDFPAGTCRGADLQGVCERIPATCTDDHKPVCGCDGKTYGNDCQRKKAAVQKDHAGECRAPRKDVHVRGCPYRGRKDDCLMIGSGRKTYDISAASPRPRTGHLVVSLAGNKDSGPNTCMQGTRLKDIEWAYTKQKCPAPKKRAKK